MSGGEPERAADLDDAIANARKGGERGLTALFETFHPRLLRYLRARDRHRADDLAAETWLAVASRIDAFEGDGSAFAAWVFTIARQRLADARRTSIRRRTDSVADVPEHGHGPSPEDVALDELDAQGAVDLIVGSLTRDQADVVLLRVLGGLPTADIAAAMDRTEVWVRVTHHRAIRRLQQRLGERGA